MNGRMVGKCWSFACGCCEDRAGTGKGKKGMRRIKKRRERAQWKQNLNWES